MIPLGLQRLLGFVTAVVRLLNSLYLQQGLTRSKLSIKTPESCHHCNRPPSSSSSLLSSLTSTFKLLSNLIQYEVLHCFYRSSCPGHRCHAMVQRQGHASQRRSDHVCPYCTRLKSIINNYSSLRIEVSQDSSATRGPGMTTKPNGVVNTNLYDACLKVCFGEEPKCPEGWVSWNSIPSRLMANSY